MGVPIATRLIGRLNRVFSKDPAATLALRIRSAGGLTWRVSDTHLTVKRPGVADLKLALEGVTLLELQGELTAAGVDVVYANDPEVLALGAVALMQGEGDQNDSDGDWLRIYTSLLWAWAEPVGRWLDVARADIPRALGELVVPAATGYWADLWGSYFGLVRGNNETDAHLDFRTCYEWHRARSNPVAIEANIAALLDQNITVREPWQEMFLLSESSGLSGGDHFPNAIEFCYHTAQLTSPDFIDFTAASLSADADRPAGTIFLPPVTVPPPFFVDASIDGRSIACSIVSHATFDVQDYDGEILSFNCSLSNTFVELAPQVSTGQSVFVSVPGLSNPPSASFKPIVVAVGEICLSNGAAFGDLEASFPGAALVETGAPATLSGAVDLVALSSATQAASSGLLPKQTPIVAPVQGGLSDYSDALSLEPIDVWCEASAAFSAPQYVPVPAQGAFVGEGVVYGAGPLQTVAVAEASSSDSSFALQNTYGPISYTVVVTVETQPVYASGAAAAGAAAYLHTGDNAYAVSSASASASGSLSTGINLVSGSSVGSVASGSLSTAVQAAALSAASGGGAGGLSTGIQLAASAAAAASSDVYFGTRQLFTGAGAAQASASASLTTADQAAAVSIASASGAGALSTGIQLGVTAAAVTGSVATLATGIVLAGSAAGQSSGAGAFTTADQAGAIAAASSSASGSLSTGISLAAATSADSASTGALTTGDQLAAVSAGDAEGSATLTTGDQAAAVSVACGNSTADLTTAIQLAAGSAATSGATGRMGQPGAAMLAAASSGLAKFS